MQISKLFEKFEDNKEQVINEVESFIQKDLKVDQKEISKYINMFGSYLVSEISIEVIAKEFIPKLKSKIQLLRIRHLLELFLSIKDDNALKKLILFVFETDMIKAKFAAFNVLKKAKFDTLIKQIDEIVEEKIYEFYLDRFEYERKVNQRQDTRANPFYELIKDNLETIEKYESLKKMDGYIFLNENGYISLYKLENSNDDKEKQEFLKETLLFVSKDYDYYLEKKRISLDEDIAKGFMEIFEVKNWEESIDKLKHFCPCDYYGSPTPLEVFLINLIDHLGGKEFLKKYSSLDLVKRLESTFKILIPYEFISSSYFFVDENLSLEENFNNLKEAVEQYPNLEKEIYLYFLRYLASEFLQYERKKVILYEREFIKVIPYEDGIKELSKLKGVKYILELIEHNTFNTYCKNAIIYILSKDFDDTLILQKKEELESNTLKEFLVFVCEDEDRASKVLEFIEEKRDDISFNEKEEDQILEYASSTYTPYLFFYFLNKNRLKNIVKLIINTKNSNLYEWLIKIFAKSEIDTGHRYIIDAVYDLDTNVDQFIKVYLERAEEKFKPAKEWRIPLDIEDIEYINDIKDIGSLRDSLILKYQDGIKHIFDIDKEFLTKGLEYSTSLKLIILESIKDIKLNKEQLNIILNYATPYDRELVILIKAILLKNDKKLAKEFANKFYKDTDITFESKSIQSIKEALEKYRTILKSNLAFDKKENYVVKFMVEDLSEDEIEKLLVNKYYKPSELGLNSNEVLDFILIDFALQFDELLEDVVATSKELVSFNKRYNSDSLLYSFKFSCLFGVDLLISLAKKDKKYLYLLGSFFAKDHDIYDTNHYLAGEVYDCVWEHDICKETLKFLVYCDSLSVNNYIFRNEFTDPEDQFDYIGYFRENKDIYEWFKNLIKERCKEDGPMVSIWSIYEILLPYHEDEDQEYDSLEYYYDKHFVYDTTRAEAEQLIKEIEDERKEIKDGK